MDSPRIKKLRGFLSEYADGHYRNSVIEFAPDSGAYFIFVSGDLPAITPRAKAMLERRASAEVGGEIVVSQLASMRDSAIEGALFSLLELLIQPNLIDVVVSFPADGTAEVVILVDDRIAIPEAKQVEVRRKAVDFLRQYERTVEKLFFSEVVDRLPSPFQVLRTAYIQAPATLEALGAALTNSGYIPPSLRWLNRQLDTLLRKKLVAWEHDLYTVTSLGVGMLPSGRGNSSADVHRALALSRKSW